MVQASSAELRERVVGADIDKGVSASGAAIWGGAFMPDFAGPVQAPLGDCADAPSDLRSGFGLSTGGLPEPCENRHLARATKGRVRSGKIAASDLIMVSGGDAVGPSAKLCAVPFKHVSGMPEPVGRNTKHTIILGIGCCDDHMTGPHLRKHRALEQGQPVGRDMLDRFNQHRAVEIGKCRAAFSHGAKFQLDLGLRVFLQGVPACPQTVQRLRADINSDNTLDPGLFCQPNKQVAIAATKIENRARPGLDDNFKRLCKAFFV